MDTGTHLVMGIGLAGLAMVDPVVAGSPAVHTAVLVGTIAGSQAPDLDNLLRLKGNACYIRNHRGMSHSLPAVLLWTIAITGLLQLIYRGSLPWLHVGSWVLLSVAVHVFTDLFNAYGTQAMRPFNEKWISWNIIHIFDPVIFTVHLIAILLWAAGLVNPAVLFPLMYLLLVVYFVWRTYYALQLVRKLPRLDHGYHKNDSYIAIPTISLSIWNIVKQSEDDTFHIGNVRNGQLKWLDKTKCSSHPAVEKSKNDPAIRSFLYFTNFACADVKEHNWGYEVRWADVRYRHRKQYPFVGVLMMNKQYETVGSYVGWLSDDRLMKRLRMDTY
ncbi:metal-dependent hydrolase [Paenibacillus sp. 1011MAR3C5]|uniref:metal-dependent hydrolase n=1 Tax=Paenibacillus sp. 1011MAR3C5 TaxID=1675787 RepID=UPI000E6C9AF5|nr:metal-dependent hydrolase [Paenibacillus sp. 1011MAR3C5]RJE88903.1 metal-dependent hydrolase [Paenibacillus sp. 1011MAR3C5]